VRYPRAHVNEDPSSKSPPGGDPRFEIGQLLAGRYEIERLLGRGAMGVVYRVRDHELDEIVALKLLRRELVGSAEMLARFRTEVKLARRVTHRNVARTFDIGEHDGERFLTMELIDGASLADVLEKEGPLEISRALDITKQMAKGMAAAHDAGVIHRDLKPENVSLERRGRVVLMDFGIARTSVVEAPSQTVGGMIGTPTYMAPEQVVGSPDVDARADLYAAGAVLYEMLTGRVPWSGPSAYVVATARLTSPPPDPRDHRPELSAEVAALVMKCMARAPERRFADARELLEALAELPSPMLGGATTAPGASEVPRAAAGSSSSSSPAASTRFERRYGTEGLRDDLTEQLHLMAHASPSYRRLLEELDELLASEAAVEVLAGFDRAWQRRSFEGPYERPLLTLAALRADARSEGAAHPLYAAIAAEVPDSRAVTAEALRSALARERIGFWITLRTRRVQTNEVTRSLAWLWPATLAGAGGSSRPLSLFDIGASAGLNLVAEAVEVRWRRSTGASLSVARDLDIRRRTGFDPRPLDVTRAEDRDWLKACVWPEQRARLERLDAAIAAFPKASPRPELLLLRGSSAPAKLEAATEGHPEELAIAYQTLVSGYMPSDERAAYEAGMRAWLAHGPRGRRVWSTLELEAIGEPDLSCALDVHVGTGGAVERVRLGRTSYHPETIVVAEGAEARLTQLLRAS
jgi:serine/threonine protein kinase